MSNTLTASPAEPRTPRRSKRRRMLRGTAWLAWRQNRALSAGALCGLVAVSAYLLLQRATVLHDLAAAGSLGCGGTTHDSRCLDSWMDAANHTLGVNSFSAPLLAAVPVLVGMFVGAPLLALEYERGTSRLAWVQSVSRGRWFAVRLAVPAAVVLVVSSVLALLAHAAWQTDQGVQAVVLESPFQSLVYPVIGVTAVATALFALALGTVVGMLLRRTVLAIGVTGALVAAAEVGLRLLRPHLWPTVYAVQTGTHGQFLPPLNALVVSTGTLMPDGSRIPSGDCGRNATCAAARTVYGYYQPASHFWPIQFVESGILLVAALALVVFAHRWTRRSPA